MGTLDQAVTQYGQLLASFYFIITGKLSIKICETHHDLSAIIILCYPLHKMANTARRVHLPGMEDTGDCQGEIYNTGKKSLYSNTFADKEVHDIIQMFICLCL